MYQINFSLSADNSKWYYDSEKILQSKVKNFNGIIAAKEACGRLNVSIACENEYKNQINKMLKESIVEIFLTVVKFEYLQAALNLPQLKGDSYNILLHTLVAFDRDSEKSIIEKNLKIIDNMALDGIFNFKLNDLKKRWNDIAELAVNNAMYLNNDETLNELLKFLISAVSPKIMKLDVIREDGQYNIKGKYHESNFEYQMKTSEQLLLYLINIAPLELTLHGSFAKDDRLYKRLVSIFDAKP